jgi:hypothetical protein
MAEPLAVTTSICLLAAFPRGGGGGTMPARGRLSAAAAAQ